MTRPRLAGLLSLALSLSLGGGTPVRAAVGDILVYTANGLNQGYSFFGAAAGRTVVTTGVLPSDITPNACVILSVNGTVFTPAQKTQLSGYVNGGGLLIAVAENAFFPDAIATMNDLADALGSTMDLVSATIDPGFNDTGNTRGHRFTEGVTAIRYAAGSEVNVGSRGQPLIIYRPTPPDRTMIAVEHFGAGAFVLTGDSNWISNNSGGAYSDPLVDNPRLAKNLCGTPIPTVIEADPLFDIGSGLHFPGVSARLIDDRGAPLPGLTVSFSAGATPLCSGVTGQGGVASCEPANPVDYAAIVLNGGIEASFAGSPRYASSDDAAPLIQIFGTEIP